MAEICSGLDGRNHILVEVKVDEGRVEAAVRAEPDDGETVELERLPARLAMEIAEALARMTHTSIAIQVMGGPERRSRHADAG